MFDIYSSGQYHLAVAGGLCDDWEIVLTQLPTRYREVVLS